MMVRVPLSSCLTPPLVLACLHDLSWPVLLESARFHPLRGRYSYFTAEPQKTWLLETAEFGSAPFDDLRQALQTHAQVHDPAGPPFQGGIIGLLSYELGHCWEQLPQVPADDFTTPPLVAGLYDWCICWDHQENQVWLISPFSPDKPEFQTRFQPLLNRLNSGENQTQQCLVSQPENDSQQNITEQNKRENRAHPDSSQSAENYQKQIARVLEYIQAGDIYQANLSRKLHYQFSDQPVQLYLNLREANPAPFAAYFRPNTDWALVSASPEQFLQVENRQITTRPIKGTRRRWGAGELDLLQAAELLDSEKDRAENTMIVDLMRNDLARVCEIGSVRVPRWCELESFEKVHHLVSEVTGKLRDDCDLWDLLAAAFPGGSITGAPKIRAMEIISELEQTARGAYCGSLFVANWQGNLQSSILIRTLTWKSGWVQCPVGGGIVADSLPDEEYQETVTKSSGLILATPGHSPQQT